MRKLFWSKQEEKYSVLLLLFKEARAKDKWGDTPRSVRRKSVIGVCRRIPEIFNTVL
jgi:hypothetical protein